MPYTAGNYRHNDIIMLHSLKTNETILLIIELAKTDEGEEELMAAISHAHGHLKQQDPLQQIL